MIIGMAAVVEEKGGLPVDISMMTQILLPIADKWYSLGIKLGFSDAELDLIKNASSTPPGAHMTVIVREGLKKYGNQMVAFVSALTTALQSPELRAVELATALRNSTCAHSIATRIQLQMV